MSKLGQNLRLLRVQKGISQQLLAKELYVSSSTLSNWERGKGEPPSEVLQKIADYYQVSLDMLYGRDLKLAEPYEEVKVSIVNTENSFKQKILMGIFTVLTGVIIFTQSTWIEALWFISVFLVLVSEGLAWFPRLTKHVTYVRIPKAKTLCFARFEKTKTTRSTWLVLLSVFFVTGILAIVFTHTALTEQSSSQWTALGVMAVVFMLLYFAFVWMGYPWLFHQGSWSVKQLNRHATLNLTRMFLYFDWGLMFLFGVVFLSTSPINTHPQVPLFSIVLLAKLLLTDTLMLYTKQAVKSLVLATCDVDGQHCEPLSSQF